MSLHAVRFCVSVLRVSERKNTEFVEEKTHVHDPDIHSPDELAGQEVPEEPGILEQAGRERPLEQAAQEAVLGP